MTFCAKYLSRFGWDLVNALDSKTRQYSGLISSFLRLDSKSQ
jgi:hypothetical protein